MTRALLCLTGLALLLSAAGRADAGLIGLYQFNDPANLGKDTSGNNNNATNIGTTYSASGYQDGAAVFSGSAYLESLINVSPSSLPQLTWGAWAKPTTKNAVQTILSSDNGAFDREIDIDDAPLGGHRGQVQPSWSAFTGSNASGDGILPSGVTPSISDWTFLAAVYNQSANSLTFYVNDQSFTATTNFNTSSAAIFDIGRDPGFGQFFSGSIDNVFVYDQALSATQIADIRANGFPAAAVPEPSSLTLLGTGAVFGLLSKSAKVIAQCILEPETP